MYTTGSRNVDFIVFSIPTPRKKTTNMPEIIETAPKASTWSAWAEATEAQRAHFSVETNHKAWARTCTKCGEGDLVERKHVPTGNHAGLAGQGFPPLPLPVLAANQRQPRFRTPTGRVHVC